MPRRRPAGDAAAAVPVAAVATGAAGAAAASAPAVAAALARRAAGIRRTRRPRWRQRAGWAVRGSFRRGPRERGDGSHAGGFRCHPSAGTRLRGGAAPSRGGAAPSGGDALDLRLRLDHPRVEPALHPRSALAGGAGTCGARRAAASAATCARTSRRPPVSLPSACRDAPLPVCGVLFEAAGALDFDAREAGYDRAALPPEQLEVLGGESACRSGAALRAMRDACAQQVAPPVLDVRARARRARPRTSTPSADTWTRACSAAWESAAAPASPQASDDDQRPRTTGSTTPMSRRPWLHRPRHGRSTRCSASCRSHTPDERRHPEDFSGRWAGCLRGLWGVPPRNPQFVGREAEPPRPTRRWRGRPARGRAG